jgi:hypothetical protein
MLTKTVLTLATILALGSGISASPTLAQSRGQMESVNRILAPEYSRELLPNYDREVNGSDASTPGHN